MTYDDTNEVIEELFKSHLWKCRIGLQTTKRGINFIFDCVNLWITNVIKQTMEQMRWFICWFSGLVKKEKSYNKSEKCFQYAATIVLDYEETGKIPQRIRKIYPFINKYTWYGINFSSEKHDWVKFEKINSTIALNVLYEKEIYPTYTSKYNSTVKSKSFF